MSFEEPQAEPRPVTRFETYLLRILHYLLRHDPAGQALTLVNDTFDEPTCLTREAVELAQSTLARGCAAVLARTSGWWQARHLKDGRVVEGRLWERHRPAELGLAFSHNTMRFLIWITAEKPDGKKPKWFSPVEKDLTVGDQFFFYLAFGTLQGTGAGRYLAGKQLFMRNALCRLAFPESFAELREDVPVDFAPWLTGVGACVLEGLQQELTERLVRAERDKAKVTEWQRLRLRGLAQEQALSALLDAAELSGRRDLVRFLFPVMEEFLTEGARLESWTGGLRTLGPRLADRTETNRAALVLARMMGRLHRWEQQARVVGYFDESYAASQLYKADWEHWQGGLLAGRAQRLLEQMEPL